MACLVFGILPVEARAAVLDQFAGVVKNSPDKKLSPILITAEDSENAAGEMESPKVAIDVRGCSTALDDDTDKMTLLVALVLLLVSSPAEEETGDGGEESTWNKEQLLPPALSKSLEKLLISRINDLPEVESCEIWVSAPAPLPMPPSPSTGACSNNGSSGDGYELEFQGNNENVKVLREWGVLHQPHVLNPDALVKLRALVGTAIEEVEDNLRTHRPELKVGQDNFLFREIASRSRERFDLRLYNADEFVEEYLLSQDAIRELVSKMLDGGGGGSSTRIDNSSNAHNMMAWCDYDISVVYSKPGADQQGWHSDGNHAPASHDAGWERNGWETRLDNPYALCLFLPLIDLDEDTGYTQFWPGSHRSKNWAGFGQVATVIGSTFDGKTTAGGCIWYDYRTWHRGMPNRSTVMRPVVQVIFKQKWYVERANYGTEPIIKEG